MGTARNDTDKDGVTYLTPQMLWMDHGFKPVIPEGVTDDEFWDAWEALPIEIDFKVGGTDFEDRLIGYLEYKNLVVTEELQPTIYKKYRI